MAAADAVTARKPSTEVSEKVEIERGNFKGAERGDEVTHTPPPTR